MSGNKKALVIVGALAVIAATIIYVTKPKTKSQMVDFIVGKGYASTKSVAMTYDDNFIKAWYSAAKSGLDKFIYNGVSHWVQGGSTLIIK